MTVTEPTSQEAGQLKSGRIVAIAGPVVDVEFPTGELPDINFALEMTINVGGEDITVVAETAQQLGNSRVRAICMKPTDGLVRGTEVRNLGHPLQMPVGDGVLG
ncbi:MAG TPA: F0F1 ATP synthase subunit beta, partial [Acidimicrobiaceae bacterium]|nr:F0F1 ATP synthase subunit beta [Acidimicrobiaceae bacterium]